MLTETDIVYKVAAFGNDPQTMRVYEIMTKPCITVSPDLAVEYVARLFANSRIRRAPVIEGKLLGIISISDILRKSDFVEQPVQLYIEDRIEAARQDARAICAAKGDTSPECAAAWDVLEELQAAAAHKKTANKPSNSLEDYCANNPDALECRIYED
jgi:CBS-domain-containing membrane protein